MELQFTTLDVFTDTPFKGNPLAVVTVPPALSATLSQPQKQAIAKEFNLSETVFVHEIEDATSTERRVDIFTPTQELPFAGHPTIGTAVFLQPRGITRLLLKAGPVEIEASGEKTVRVLVPHNVHLHQQRVADLSSGRSPDVPRELADAEIGAPIFSIVNGMAFVLIELPSLEVLAMAEIGIMGLIPENLLDEGWNGGWVSRRYYYVKMGTEASADGRRVHKFRTRMVRPTMEDPATGSAACALASYLSLHVLDGTELGFEITQGVEMGRESRILLEARVENGSAGNGERALGSLHLGGTAIEVMSGTIRTRFQT